MARRVLAAVAVAVASVLAGCVTVHIEARDGEVRIVRHAGVLHIELAQPQQAIVGSVAGVGLVSAPLGTTLGYTRQRWVLIGPACRVVAWLPPGETNEPTRDELARAAGVCLIAERADGLQSTLLKETTP